MQHILQANGCSEKAGRSAAVSFADLGSGGVSAPQRSVRGGGSKSCNERAGKGGGDCVRWQVRRSCVHPKFWHSAFLGTGKCGVPKCAQGRLSTQGHKGELLSASWHKQSLFSSPSPPVSQ